MKLTKYILPIAALLMVFAVAKASAQICVYDENHKYRLEDAIRYQGDNLDFIKFCCDSLGKCTPNYFAEGKYLLTHIAAKYNKTEVLEYLVKEKNIPSDMFPYNVDRLEYEKTYTPVMFAIKNNGYESAKYLISIGVDVTRTNMYGETPLSLAKATGSQRMITLVQSAWDKAKGFSYNQIEKEKTKLRNLLKPESIKKEFAENKTMQTTKPFIEEKNLI